MIGRRAFVASFPALFGLPRVHAQARSDHPRIGFLFAASPQDVAPRIEAVRTSMAALGYAVGKQVTFEARYANGDLSRIPALAAEIVRLPATVIVSGGSTATRALVAATSTIPIVTGQDNDPVAAGQANSYARPGRNVTGFTTLTPELCGKQVALLVAISPATKRIVILGDGGEEGNTRSVAEAERAAGTLGVQTTYIDARAAGTIAQVFAAVEQTRAGGVLVLQSAYMFPRVREITDLALKSRIPAVYANPQFVRQGGLATYGVNAIDLFHRAGGYVVKILNGAKAGDLPIEQPRAFDLIVNAGTARAIGIVIPQTVLLQADEVLQ